MADIICIIYVLTLYIQITLPWRIALSPFTGEPSGRLYVVVTLVFRQAVPSAIAIFFLLSKHLTISILRYMKHDKLNYL